MRAATILGIRRFGDRLIAASVFVVLVAPIFLARL